MKIIRVLAVVILAAAAVALAWQYSRDWATLRAAAPPLGPVGQQMLQDLARESAKESTWLSMRRIRVDDAVAAAAAIEKNESDIAIVRSDVAMPRNGRSIAIFQTLHAVLIVPPRSPIEDFRGLKDRTVAIAPGDQANEKLLDLILDHYGIPRDLVRRAHMKPGDVGAALQQRKIAAAFIVGSLGGAALQTFQSVQKAMKGPPKVIGVEDAEAVRSRAIGVVATEVTKGAFGGSPVQPEEDLTTIGVTIRFVAPARMPPMVAGELTRVLFEGKAKALAGNPQMREMTAPDSDDRDYPIHPAAQAYFDGEAPTFMERFESFFWIGWGIVGLVGSIIGWVLSKVRKQESPAEAHFKNLVNFMGEVRSADLKQLDDLQARVDRAVGLLFEQRDGMSADVIAVYSVAIDYARGLIADRRARLLQEQAAS